MRFAFVFLLACGATAPPPTTTPGVRLEIVEGTPVTLADGTTVAVRGVGYAHLEDSKNLSTCTLVVERGGAREEVALAREHGGSDPESSGSALGWTFALELADPYRKPSRVVVNARKH